MKTQKAAVLSVIGTCLLLTLPLSAASPRVKLTEGTRWDAPVAGLQISISTADSYESSVPEFEVALRNAGRQDVTLNLGLMLANGKAQHPENISLNLTDASGKTRELKFFDKRYPVVAGRVDDYVVPLRAGSTYTLTLRLDQFWSPATEEFELKLSPGRYRITAQFEGVGAKTNNLDMPGIRLMNFWQGRLQSNPLGFER